MSGSVGFWKKRYFKHMRYLLGGWRPAKKFLAHETKALNALEKWQRSAIKQTGTCSLIGWFE